MTGKKTFVIIAALLAVVLLGAGALYRGLAKREPPAEPAPQAEDNKNAAPDFSMLDASGSSVSLSDYIGTPVVLNFWASWCGPCKNEMPHFNSAAAEFEGKVQFMMVSLADGSRETAESASRFIAEQGYTFPVFFDTLSEGAQAYAVRYIPTTYFIDADGNIAAYSSGAMDEQALHDGIALIYGE